MVKSLFAFEQQFFQVTIERKSDFLQVSVIWTTKKQANFYLPRKNLTAKTQSHRRFLFHLMGPFFRFPRNGELTSPPFCDTNTRDIILSNR